MAAEALRTAGAVVEALGGPTEVGRLVGRSPQAVWNWTDRNTLPADTFLVLRAELRRKRKSAPARLWGIKEPEAAE